MPPETTKIQTTLSPAPATTNKAMAVVDNSLCGFHLIVATIAAGYVGRYGTAWKQQEIVDRATELARLVCAEKN